MYKILLLAACLVATQCVFALKPQHDYAAVPDTMHLPYEKNSITTPDGATLQSWTFLADKKYDNKTTLVLAYADAGNMSWWLTQGAILSQAGFTVVMFDYRGFGGSSPFAIDNKMLYYDEFGTDVVAAVAFARKKYPHRKTGVLAYSMGTIATTLAAERCKPDFVIMDGLVTDPAAIVAMQAKNNKQLLLPEDHAAYAAKLNAMQMPMLVFSGTQDVVTTDAAVQAVKKTKPHMQVVQVACGHMMAFNTLSKEYNGSGYVERVLKFLKLG